MKIFVSCSACVEGRRQFTGNVYFKWDSTTKINGQGYDIIGFTLRLAFPQWEFQWELEPWFDINEVSTCRQQSVLV